MLSHLSVLLFGHFDQLLLPGAHKHLDLSPSHGPKRTRDDEPVMPPQSLLLGEFGAESKTQCRVPRQDLQFQVRSLRANGQRLKCSTVTDESTEEGLAIDVDARLRS
jgi:hypothetical protein